MEVYTKTAKINSESSDRQAKRDLFARMEAQAEDRFLREDRDQILPRSKRERTWRHYQRVLTLLLSSLDVPDGAQEFVSDLLSIFGFEVEEWAKLYDLDLAERLVCTMIETSPKDENYKAHLVRVADRKRKQRDSLLNYQAMACNPLIIEFQAPFVAEDKKKRPEYKLPIAEAVREIVRKCPVGASDKRLRKAIQQGAAEYVKKFDGEEKRLRTKQEHSPESDLARAATVAKKAFDRAEADERHGGHTAAIEAFRAAFDGKLGHIIREAFAVENAQKEAVFDGAFSNNSNNGSDLHFSASGKFSRPEEPEIAYETPEIAHANTMKNVGDFGPPEIRLCDSQQSASGLEGESQPQHAPPDEIRALEAFRSVGCTDFEWFYLTDETKKQGEYHRTTGPDLAEEISGIVQDAESYGDSFIVRARGSVLQLDDCEGITASLLQPFAFAVMETSRDNYQVWLAFNEPEDKAFVAERIFKGVQNIIPSTINHGAGGAIRWPGSINFKPSRNEWRIRIHSLAPGRFVTPSELDDAGLLAELSRPSFDWDPNGPAGEWPDYQKCLESKTTDGRTDRSAADAQWVFFAVKRRFTLEQISEKLSQVSERAKLSGQKYVDRTISKVLAYLRLEAKV
jgi:hypothetical protein